MGKGGFAKQLIQRGRKYRLQGTGRSDASGNPALARNLRGQRVAATGPAAPRGVRPIDAPHTTISGSSKSTEPTFIAGKKRFAKGRGENERDDEPGEQHSSRSGHPPSSPESSVAAANRLLAIRLVNDMAPMIQASVRRGVAQLLRTTLSEV
jgi:hypothetical protein